MNIKKYLWLIPALFVAYEFAEKLFEVLQDSQEFTNIISVAVPFPTLANYLAYIVGGWDFLVALAIIIIPLIAHHKRHVRYIFLWAIFWPLIPASLRFFGGVGDFEIYEVGGMILAAFISYYLYFTYRSE